MFFKKINKIVLSLLMMTSLTVAFLGAFQPIFTESQVVAPTPPESSTSGPRSINPGNDVCPQGQCPGGAQNVTFNTTRDGVLGLIMSIATWLTFIAAGVAVLFLVIGGYYYIMDNGEEEKSAKGKKIVINASIGLAVAILAYSIVILINNFLGSDNLINQFFNNS